MREATVADIATGVPAGLLAPFAALDEHALEWCVLDEDPGGGGPTVARLLVADAGAARRALMSAGLISLGTSGRAPSELFVGYDEPRATWLRIEVTTRLDLGPLRALGELTGQGCLARRVRRGPAAFLAGDDGFWALLLQAAFAEGKVAPATARRLAELAVHARHDGELGRLLDDIGPGGWSSALVLERARGGDAIIMAPLRRELERAYRRRCSNGGRLRHLADRGVHAAARARVGGGGLSLALVAPDGAGKSTLAAGLRDALPVPVCVVYMGMRHDVAGRGPDVWVLPRLVRQWRRYLVGRYNVARGRVVIFDRYSYDALLPGPRAHDPLRRARRWLFSHALPPPHVGVLLDAPGEVMFRRKGEHDVHSLERRRAHYLQLAARVPQLVVVDATRPPEEVQRVVSQLLWRTWIRRRSASRGRS
jgi:hypothetical protein